MEKSEKKEFIGEFRAILCGEMQELRGDFREEMSQLYGTIRAEIEKLNSTIHTEMAQFKIEIRQGVGVLAEDMDGKFAIVTEQFAAVHATLNSHTEMIGILVVDVEILKEDVQVLKEDVGILKEDVKEIKEEMKNKVDRSELRSLKIR